jgi:putative membrane protein
MRFAATIYTFLALMCVPGFAVAQGNKLTDPQIAHIAYTAVQIDTQAAQLALKKSKSKEVRDFATQMERDHKAVNDKALALLNKLKVKPEDNETSRTLTKQASDSRAELTKLNGAAFDKAYMQHEVDYHKAVNDTLQNTLIPGASNQELKDLLTTGLKIFQGHQQHAEQIVAELK